MELVERIEQLIEQTDKPSYKVLKEIGLPHSALFAWKKGSSPSLSALVKVAQYFNVTTDYLLGIGKGEYKPMLPMFNEMQAIWEELYDKNDPEWQNATMQDILKPTLNEMRSFLEHKERYDYLIAKFRNNEEFTPHEASELIDYDDDNAQGLWRVFDLIDKKKYGIKDGETFSLSSCGGSTRVIKNKGGNTR